MEENQTSDSTQNGGTTEASVESGSDQAQDESQAGQSGEGQSENDNSFFDPNQVPEELKGAYKQMQSAFTKKTQELANFRKEADGWKQKAESYSKYEQYIPIVEEMLSSKQQVKENPALGELVSELKAKGYSDEAIEMMKLGAQFTLNQFNQSQKDRDRQMVLETGITEAEKLDPRLNNDSLVYKTSKGEKTFGQIVVDYAAPKIQAGMHPVEATKEAIELVDALIGTGKQAGKEELSTLAKNKASKFPQVKSSPQSAVSNARPKSIREAAEEAAKELGL